MNGDGSEGQPRDVDLDGDIEGEGTAEQTELPLGDDAAAPGDGEDTPAVRHRGVLDPARDEELPVGELADPARLRAVIQSLLLVTDRSMTPVELAEALGPGVPPSTVREVAEAWRGQLDREGAGIRLMRVAGGYRLRTDPASGPWVRQLTGRRPVRLSRAALESLAIVAYRQPVTRAEVDSVRGVDSSVVLRSLLDKNLLRIVGRRDEPGRPMMYGTTRIFLEVFGLDRLTDLPSLKEFTDLALAEQADLFQDDSLGLERRHHDDAGVPEDGGANEGNQDGESD